MQEKAENLFTFEDTDEVTYQFAEGKDNTTYPVSYTAKKDLTMEDGSTLSEGDVYKIAEIKNGKVRIPISAFCFRKFNHGMLQGNLMITVSCSVGEAHMPESTARLIFKL